MKTALLLLVTLPSLAQANPLELGVAFGGHGFSPNSELGVLDHMSEPGPRSTMLVGARLGVALRSWLAVEAEAVVIPTHDDVLGMSATVYGARAHVRLDLTTWRVRPFLVAGLGVHVLRTSSPQLDNDVDRAYHWGGGIRTRLSDTLEARLDVRHLIVPDRTLDGATSELEVTAGLTIVFGERTPPHPTIAIVGPTPPATIPTPAPLPPVAPRLVLVELTGIEFELDSARIDHASLPLLERVRAFLVAHPEVALEIAGHTSADGDPARNQQLSLDRALAVKHYLTDHGIAEARLTPVGLGADEPIADNATPTGRRRNRRIEFRLAPAE
jgi:outer membrane protein OmpA-like peptidoglycan-associated protein